MPTNLPMDANWEAPMLRRIPKNTSAAAEAFHLHWAMIRLATAIRSVGRACFSLDGQSKSFSFRIE